ncbi:MAG: trimethylamine methyltransferase [Chloroflexi bacterium]|nr:trimethylamine methyltransferase [Chloroflexota bacterium]
MSPVRQATHAYTPLSDADITRIHDASLTVLERTGVEVTSAEALAIFQQAGAAIDPDRSRVFLPRGMVEDVLAQACHRFTLAGRDEAHDLDMGGERVYMGTGGAAISVLDLDGTVRESRLTDIAEFARLVDCLHNIHFYQIPVVARDIPDHLHDINQVYAALSNTTKHIQTNLNSLSSARDVMALATMVAGSPAALAAHPFLSFVTCCVNSPLRYDPLPTALMIELVRNDLPVAISCAPITGMTAPMALAGSLVQINAEVLSGLVLANLVRPGARILAGYVPTVADHRQGGVAVGTPEFALMNAAAAQLAHFYDIPIYNSAGTADSKLPDVQAGYEKAMTSTIAALSGANFIHHTAGMLESLLCVASEQYVIDDDINGSVMRLVRGIEVDDQTLSVDVIDEVCNGGQFYLENSQTLELMRSECFYPRITDRKPRIDWEAKGSLDMRERARHRACTILTTHQPTRLPAAVDQAIRARFEILLPPELSGSPIPLGYPVQLPERIVEAEEAEFAVYECDRR